MQFNYSEMQGLSPKNNQRLFYISSCINFLTLILIIAICSYSASLVFSASLSLGDLDKILTDVNDLLPEARTAVHLLRQICNSTELKARGIQC